MCIGIGTAFLAWKVAGIITAVTTALAGLSAAEAIAAAKTWLLNAAMAANPVGIVVAAIAGLIAAFVVLYKKSDKFRNFVQGIWEAVKMYVNFVIEYIKTAWKVIKKVWETIKKAVSMYIDFIVTYFKTAFNVIKTVWNAITGFFKGLWEGIKAVFNAVVDFFTGIFTSAYEGVKAVWEAITGFFTGIWDGIKNTFNVVGDWFAEKFENAVDRIKDIFGKVKDFFSDVWDGIKSVFGNVADWFKDKFSKAWQAVKDVFSTGGKVFEGIKDGILNGLKTVINALIRGINKVISVPFDGLNAALRKIRDIEILGLTPFDWISEIGVPQIPELEKGGVLKKGQIGLLEGKGTEAVVPLENDTDGLRKIAGLLAEDLNRTGNIIKGNDGSNTINNYNFTQTNNSPKSLSRYDIYRQTRNLLNAAKGV